MSSSSRPSSSSTTTTSSASDAGVSALVDLEAASPGRVLRRRARCAVAQRLATARCRPARRHPRRADRSARGRRCRGDRPSAVAPASGFSVGRAGRAPRGGHTVVGPLPALLDPGGRPAGGAPAAGRPQRRHHRCGVGRLAADAVVRGPAHRSGSHRRRRRGRPLGAGQGACPAREGRVDGVRGRSRGAHGQGTGAHRPPCHRRSAVGRRGRHARAGVGS